VAGEAGRWRRVPVEFVGYEILSLRVGGTQLWPNAVPNLARIPLYSIYSNENEDGQAVGGSTEPQSVPFSPFLAPLLVIALAASGAGRWLASLPPHSRRREGGF